MHFNFIRPLLAPFHAAVGARLPALLILATASMQGHAQTALADDYRIVSGGLVYKVAKDETLISIARRFTGRSADWRELGRVNRIANDRAIPVGTEVLIPARLLPDVPVRARIHAVSGEVRVRAGDGREVPASIGMELREGAVIVTGAHGYASIALSDGTWFTVHAGSQVALQLLRAKRYAGTPRTRLFLEQGRMESRVVPAQEKGGAHYEVVSPIAVSGVRGTVFRTARDAGRALNEVLEGRVAVAPLAPSASRAARERLLDAGYGGVVENGRTGMPRPLLTAPALTDGYQLQQRLPLQFDLHHPQARSFRINVTSDAGGADIVAAASAQADAGTATVKLADLPDGQYHLHAHAVDPSGLWGQAVTVPFRLKARPFPPLLLRPQEKVQGSSPGVAVDIEMAWTQSREAEAYRLQIASEPSFAAPVLDQEVPGTDGSHRVALAPGDYFWRAAVIGKRDGQPDQGPFGDARQVRVLEASAAPEVVQGEGETRFSWSGRPGQRFTFQVAGTASFDALLANQTLDAPTSTLHGLAPGTYYARVRSIDSDGFIGEYSPAQRFVVPARWRASDGSVLRSESGPVAPGY